MGSPAQTYLPPASQSTVQPTLPAGAPSLDKKLTHANEIAASTEGHGLGAGPEAGERQKQLEEKVGPSAGTSAMVPVLSLLTIIFVLTIVLLYVLCKRRREQALQHSPGKLDLWAPLPGTRRLLGRDPAPSSSYAAGSLPQTNMKAVCTVDHRP